MRNMTRRRMMLISSSQTPSRLPPEYQEVQWLRGTGTQYCVTSYNAHRGSDYNIKSGLIGDATVLNLSGSKIAISSKQASGNGNCGINLNNSYFRFDYGDTNSSFSYLIDQFGDAPLNLHYEILPNQGSLPNKRDLIKLNNLQENVSISLAYNYENYLIGAYRDSNDNIIVHNNDVLIKVISLYENDVLLSDFIPCKRKSDNKAGFYETGTGLFLTNQGSDSDWLIGPNM